MLIIGTLALMSGLLCLYYSSLPIPASVFIVGFGFLVWVCRAYVRIACWRKRLSPYYTACWPRGKDGVWQATPYCLQCREMDGMAIPLKAWDSSDMAPSRPKGSMMGLCPACNIGEVQLIYPPGTHPPEWGKKQGIAIA